MQSEIYRIAYRLQAEGKTPSVALVRARLSTPTSLPVIVQALQQWKLNPNLGKHDIAEQTQEDSIEATMEIAAQENIAQRLAALEGKVDYIIELLKKDNKG